MKTRYPNHSAVRCLSCGKEIKNQHPDTKDKWVYFEVNNVGYHHCFECENKNKGGNK